MFTTFVSLTTATVNIFYMIYFIVNNVRNKEEMSNLYLFLDLIDPCDRHDKFTNKNMIISSLSNMYCALIASLSFFGFMTSENVSLFFNVLIPLINILIFKFSFEGNIKKIIECKQLKKELKIAFDDIDKEEIKLKEEISKENIKTILGIEDLSFGELKLGRYILYEIDNTLKNKDLKLYGIILLSPKELLFNHRGFFNNGDSRYILTLFNHSIEKVGYADVITNLIYSKASTGIGENEENITINERIITYNKISKEFSYEPTLEIINKKNIDLRNILEHNKDEEVISVFNTIRNYVEGKSDLEKDDLIEIIEIYIKDDSTKKDLYAYMNSKENDTKIVNITSFLSWSKKVNFFKKS